MSKRPAPDPLPDEGRDVRPRLDRNPVHSSSFSFSLPGQGPSVPSSVHMPPPAYPHNPDPNANMPPPSMSIVRGGAPQIGPAQPGPPAAPAAPVVAPAPGTFRQAGILASGGAAPSAAALYANAMSSIRSTPNYTAPQFYYPPGAGTNDPYANHNPFLREQQIVYQQQKAADSMRKHRQRVRADGKEVVLRRMGGVTWEDDTLADWPENDYRLFVGNLGNDVSNEPLRKAFSKYKSLAMVRVIRNKKTGRTKGYGFVSFLDPQDCLKAYREMNGQYIMNRPCQIKKSEWKSRNLEEKDKKKLKRGEVKRRHKKPYKAPPNLPRYTPEPD